MSFILLLYKAMSTTCDHCSDPAKFKCNKCGLFAYCSYKCSDAHALEHARVCYNSQSRDPAYLQKHLTKSLAYAEEELHPQIYDLMENMHVDKAHALLIETKTAFKKKPSFKAKMARRKKSSPKIGRRGRSKSPKTKKPSRVFGRSKSRSKSASPKKGLFQKKEKSVSPKTRRSLFGRSRSRSSSDSSSSASPRSRGSSLTRKVKDKARRFRDKTRDFQQAVRNYRSRSPSPTAPLQRTNVIYTQPARPSTIVVPPAQAPQVVVLPQTTPKPIVVNPPQEDASAPKTFAPAKGLIAYW